uniref:NADH dehydrogenase subunit 6 n=1 Tax=Dicrocoelium chinensis TaxID=483157 RepID=A0A096XCB4_DICCN|nr:NADH dehydrogenase subunit 6 [Dicrocoelium chinensis]AHG06494.1 NADH dehydrogenase subunit 6 [Dicrocoelium chinensis]
MYSVSFFTSLYLTTILAFSFVSHPVAYCVFLVISALCVNVLTFLVVGFSWYLVLFSLVYIGGIYVLFIFVSVRNPNPAPSVGVSLGSVFLLFLFFFFGGFNMFAGFGSGLENNNLYFFNIFEGFTYCMFWGFLWVGFIWGSVGYSSKDSFYR